MSMSFHLSLCLSLSLSLFLSPSLLYLRMSFDLTGRASFKDTVGIELEHSEIANNIFNQGRLRERDCIN